MGYLHADGVYVRAYQSANFQYAPGVGRGGRLGIPSQAGG